MVNQFIIALLLSSVAGLSTTVGALLTFLVKRPTARMLSLGLGFSVGVMLTISFLEMLPSALELSGTALTYIAFFVGMFVMAGLDLFVPHISETPESCDTDINPELLRTGKLTALGVAFHNFPEGAITFLGTIIDIRVGILLTIAISLHNIPEGLSVAIPIYCATGERKQAFFITFLSGIAEPIGALIAGILLYPFLNETIMGISLAIVAGIMIFLSLHELLPVAHENSAHRRTASLGMMAGMIIMVITIPLLS